MSALELTVGERVLVRPSIGASFEAEVVEVRASEVLVRHGRKRRAFPRARIWPLERAAVVPEAQPEALERATVERPGLVAVPKDEPTRDPEYLAYVRRWPCMSCRQKAPSEAHHWAPEGARGGGGMGLKDDDRYTVPLCRGCHQHYHDHGALPRISPALTRDLFLAKQRKLREAWERRGERGARPQTTTRRTP